jgi:DMSO/TMAO reductase YedYZ molybdopterin-dependent catalytic subunit
MRIPPGQFVIDGFPRFGASRRPPSTPNDPVIEVTGTGVTPHIVAISEFENLPRHEMRADFHCIAGWTAANVRWSGVRFADLYRGRIAPRLAGDTSITHVVFEGLDGFRSIVTIEDALARDVLLADHMEGQSLTADHGAPLRLVSPQQYGFVSTKYLCKIELHTARPPDKYHPDRTTQLTLTMLKPHPRARVWREERHRYLPARVVRPVYRRLIRYFLPRDAPRPHALSTVPDVIRSTESCPGNDSGDSPPIGKRSPATTEGPEGDTPGAEASSRARPPAQR